MDNLEAMLAAAVKQAIAELKPVLPEAPAAPAAPAAAPEMVAKADVEAMFASLRTEFEGMVKKAFDDDREGVGRRGTVEPQLTLESDPAAYLVAKAATLKDESEWTRREKDVIAGITLARLVDGMRAAGKDEE